MDDNDEENGENEGDVFGGLGGDKKKKDEEKKEEEIDPNAEDADAVSL
jgi:hypothetical protein